jgi:hypothetical protein
MTQANWLSAAASRFRSRAGCPSRAVTAARSCAVRSPSASSPALGCQAQRLAKPHTGCLDGGAGAGWRPPGTRCASRNRSPRGGCAGSAGQALVRRVRDESAGFGVLRAPDRAGGVFRWAVGEVPVRRVLFRRPPGQTGRACFRASGFLVASMCMLRFGCPCGSRRGRGRRR